MYNGKEICNNFNTSRGCNARACRNAHICLTCKQMDHAKMNCVGFKKLSWAENSEFEIAVIESSLKVEQLASELCQYPDEKFYFILLDGFSVLDFDRGLIHLPQLPYECKRLAFCHFGYSYFDHQSHFFRCCIIRTLPSRSTRLANHKMTGLSQAC